MRLVDGLQASQRARRGNRLMADIVEPVLDEKAETVAGFAFELVRPHVGGCPRGRRGVKVDVLVHAARAHVHRRGAKPGDATHHRIDHGLRERASHRGVGRIAAGL
jgi:hypothetical protein